MKEGITREDIEKNKLLAALSYIWILFILYWLVDSKFVKFHAKQSLVIFSGDVILFIAGFFLKELVPLWGLIYSLLRIGLFALRVMGFIYAIKGEVKGVPIVVSIVK